jgi:hypothetical protein
LIDEKKVTNPSAFQCFKHYLTLAYQYGEKKFKKFNYSVFNMGSEAVEIKTNDINNAKQTYQGLQRLFFYNTQSKENKGDEQAIVTVCICLEKALEAATNNESQSTDGNLETIETIEKEAQERLDQFHEKYNSIPESWARPSFRLFRMSQITAILSR